jgi:Type II secretion system (T2SS), protein M subtype b
MTVRANASTLSANGRWGAALLLAGIIVMAGLASLPYIWHANANETLAEKNLELRFIEAKLKSARNNRRSNLTAVDNIEPIFVAGNTPGLALAEMQNFVGTLASGNGMSIDRLQPLQTELDGSLAVLRMEVETVGSIESLRGYLLALETAEPVMFINRVRISAPDNQAEASGALPSDKLTVLVQLEAFGWWEALP